MEAGTLQREDVMGNTLLLTETQLKADKIFKSTAIIAPNNITFN